VRTVFFGTPEIAVPTLQALAAHHEVLALVCQPDRPKGRSGRPVPPPTKEWAVAQGMPVHQPEKLNDGAFEQWLRAQAPEVCTVAAYGRLLKQPILDLPPQGWLNVHPSLLPRYRGPSPIQAAVMNGDAETGVTIMRMILEMDAGDIVLQERTPIGPDENAAELSLRLGKIGARMMLDALAMLESGTLVETPQDPAQVSHCHMLQKEDGRIDWTRSAWELHNQVRACVPWPGAFTTLNGQPLKLLRTTLSDAEALPAPATVLPHGKEALPVSTGHGLLNILELQPAGKRPMAAADFLRGHPLPAGQRLGT
jgi:methionyl-tRNA formyltransferase